MRVTKDQERNWPGRPTILVQDEERGETTGVPGSLHALKALFYQKMAGETLRSRPKSSWHPS